ncbi:MAG: sugar phosphate isomerase/epimerase [Endomicrobiales bacterium]|nr:sugar phosphate isomerase/epimerase [Endomicrobiales bacterium]
MLSISTAYNISRHKTWNELLRNTRDLGFRNIELNVEIPEEWFEDIEKSVKEGKINISSVHNYCPRLTDLKPGMSVFFAYSPSSLDEKERKLAVKYTKKTIDWAGFLGAGIVVLHAGDVQISPNGRDIFVYAKRFGRHGKLFDKYHDAVIEERKKKAGKHLNALMKTLDEVLAYASKKNVTIGLENRNYYHEIPTLEEAVFLLDKFDGAPVAYWHDVGHAEVSVRLGFVEKHEDYLKSLQNRMAGVHMHNLKELADHYAPISGDFDFNILKGYVKKDTIKVIEAHEKATDTQIRKSIEHLRKIGLV